MKAPVLLFALSVLCMGCIARADEVPGRLVFERWCAPCHAPGPGHPGTAALAAVYKGARPGALEQRTDLSGEVVRAAVRHGVFSMPPFRKTEISDAELDALVVYLTHH